MDDDFSPPEVFPGADVPNSCSMDSFFDELLADTPHQHACTHTHTCNPPGPDLSHTHTCFHVHTKILSAASDETADSKGSAKKRGCGNREAVRKYREKKKARAASLEDEVVQLRALNQQLMKRLQGQTALEAEVARLRCLLVDIRGRIEGEIGSFPYQKRGGGGELGAGGHVVNPCNLRCEDGAYCMQPGMDGKVGGENGGVNGQGFGGCEIGEIQCLGGANLGSKEYFGCGAGNGMAPGCVPDVNRINGAAHQG